MAMDAKDFVILKDGTAHNLWRVEKIAVNAAGQVELAISGRPPASFKLDDMTPDSRRHLLALVGKPDLPVTAGDAAVAPPWKMVYEDEVQPGVRGADAHPSPPSSSSSSD